MHSTKTVALLGLMASVAAFPDLAAGQTRDPLDAPSRMSSPPEVSVARVSLSGGAQVEFVELGRGHIGVVELTVAGPPLVSLLSRLDATPLEMFLALAAPGSKVPDALLADHAARIPSSPRLLSLAQVNGPPIHSFDCDPAELFVEDWFATYEGEMSIVVADSYYDVAEPQRDWHTNSPGNLSTHLGICNGDDETSITVQIHAYDEDEPSSWHHIVSSTFGDHTRLTFHTDLAGNYRLRMLNASGTPIEQIGVGGAFTKDPAFGIVSE